MSAPVTVITGTRKGIGQYLAQYYADLGHHVVGCSRNEADWGHDRYDHIVADVADEADAKQVFKHVKKKYDRLDNMINNAGIASMNHSLLTPLSTVKSIFDTNVTGTFLFTREAAKLMMKHRYGRIVNFSTVAYPLQLPGESIYAASKAAVVSFSEIAAREYAEYGITVNCVGPTPVMTDLIRTVPRAKMDELIARQAIRRMGTFEDVANAVDFFIRKESDFITGQCLYLGGV
ncbi:MULTISPECIES: SDR family NAD(P)-dependent oxidoreductase [Cohnella]|uniref:3-oxoacyl-[acyl-carrier protein] reductase n=1 Tax=Cohnella phaseoli TaxID=456490 RepID=A0A3D9KJH4_9BACL|nr:SDR family oxidoreductase [Cohnella phaseoli]RED86539.1 3-oxoacyl-[acyl-carrier protein] reductase [Cohnella phaseoli]